jgi:lysyl-tRNA synthetase class 2
VDITLCGRVWGCTHTELVVGDSLTRSTLLRPRDDGGDIREGDLVRVRARRDGDTLVAVEIERVFRPAISPFARGRETARLGGRGLARRLVQRAEVLARVRACFASRGFLEVETPSVAVCPGLDLHLTAFEAKDTVDGASLGYLVTSPEYYLKRLVAGGVSRCFELSRCFRSGESGTRHEPEFTMIEWYRAWGALEDLLEDAEAVVRAACGADAVRAESGGEVRLDQGFERITVREAFARWVSEVRDPIALAERDESEYFRLLGERIEPQLGRDRPTFLTHFAARHASLSQLDPTDPSVCLRAELYVDGLELSNGFVELTDPVEQRRRFERDVADRAARGMPAYPIDEHFLSALDEGLPPSVGNAMGLDRLVAIALGTRDLRDVLAFSRRSHE